MPGAWLDAETCFDCKRVLGDERIGVAERHGRGWTVVAVCAGCAELRGPLGNPPRNLVDEIPDYPDDLVR